ncbi:hypothetical protein E2C01_074318 [Portunus trituberculatus]|uniref:Secreted protein n=1 Tax=Portunus trituberculatus TaxID=210409 RepID=A0A5B7I7Q8_PORTR|nr:hypothetical protein [Portunus trituberculatus]
MENTSAIAATLTSGLSVLCLCLALHWPMDLCLCLPVCVAALSLSPGQPPWYSGTMRALGSEGSQSARFRILSTV